MEKMRSGYKVWGGGGRRGCFYGVIGWGLFNLGHPVSTQAGDV